MTEPSESRGQVDRLLGGYFLVTATALLFPHRPAVWPIVALVHLGAAAFLLWAMPRLRRGVETAASGWRVLLDWYPLLVFPFLYWEVPLLLGAIWDGHYFDAVILRWEESLFGLQPSTWLAPRFDALLLSEMLHGAYLAYYPVIYGLPLALYIRGRREAFRATVFALLVGLTAHYVAYLVFPVQGPRYLFPPPGGRLADGPLYQLAHLVLETGSSRGAAFPSAHAAIAAIQTVNAARYTPRAMPVFAALMIGISVGAVYGGFHYAIDILVGLGVGFALGIATPVLRRRMP